MTAAACVQHFIIHLIQYYFKMMCVNYGVKNVSFAS